MAEKKNISSGAEKAERLTKKNNQPEKENAEEVKSSVKNSKKTTAKAKCKTTATKEKKAEKKTSVPKKAKTKDKPAKAKKVKKERKLSEKAAKRREARLQKRAERAEIAAKKKQARLERKLAHKEKRLEKIALMKERKAERRELRKERRDMIKNESKQARRKRIAKEKQAKREERAALRKEYLAEKKAKREHALKVRAQKRAERKEKRDAKRAENNDKRHAPGFGGWLAAVISLGVTTLALGTIVTFGWMTMDRMQAETASTYTQSLYELNSVIDNLDSDLSKAKASSSASDRARVFSDIAIESQTAETILERLPVECQMTEQLASFINKMSDSAKQMLYTVARGGELTPSQIKSLNYMYETNAKVKEEINTLISTCSGKDLIAAMRGKSSAFGDSFSTIQNNTFEVPKGIQDGPFSDSIEKTNPKGLKGAKEITAQQAEQMAREYFSDYKVSDAKCTGEATGEAFTLYNVNLTTPDGEMFVQLSKLGGKVVAFDSYKDCSSNNFSVERCIDIAEDFLSSIGYNGVKAVWSSENGTTCNLNFAPVQNGVILYPDLIKVKVCEERGIVTGIEAGSYVLNHGERELVSPTVSQEEAQSVINGNIDVMSARTALIPLDGEEILCYEFFGSMDGNEYYVYVDARTGEEVEVLTIIGTAQGKALM